MKNALILIPEKHLGNLIVSMSALYSLNEALKEFEKYIVVDERFIDIPEMFFSKKQIIPFAREKIKKSDLYQKILLTTKLIAKLRNLAPYITIDFEGRQTGALLAFLSGAKKRIGLKTGDRSYLYNIKIEIKNNDYFHKRNFYLSLVKSLGFNVVPLPQPKIKEEWIENLSKKINLNNNKTVCIHPWAGKIYKRWDLENFLKVAENLSSKATVYCIGSKNEATEIKMPNDRIINLTGKLSLGELCALMSKVNLFIGNDSGPMHLASLFNIPTIALFGSADERRWGPTSEKSFVLRGAPRCEHCIGRKCDKSFRCVRNIKVSDVLEISLKILDGKI